MVSKHRGRKGNNRLAESVKKQALNLLKTKYRGFGPTLAHEKLVEKDKLRLSDESVRQLMIAEDLWKPRKVKKVVSHQLRERRACFGELVQIDGSPYDWFEGRADACVLLVFIDDATGKLVELRFVDSESFFSYAGAAEEYFRRCGKPVAFYSDMLRKRHFSGQSALHRRWGGADAVWACDAGTGYPDYLCQHASGQRTRGAGQPDFARPPGHTCLAGGAREEMRLRGISSLVDGNAYFAEFIENFNRRFAIEPRSSVNAHRPFTAKDDLARILTWQEFRILSKNLTIQFEKVVYQIQTQRPTYSMRQAVVTVCKDVHQNITIRYKGKSLPYTIFHKQAKQSQGVPSKDVNQLLPPHKPAPDHPWRKGFATPLSKRRTVTPPKGDISILEHR